MAMVIEWDRDGNPETSEDLTTLQNFGIILQRTKCIECNGTGTIRELWLYLHTLDLDGQRYSFHSYVRPARLSDGQGEDCEAYGGRFTEAELEDLALPVTGLIRALGYVACTKWGMRFNKYARRYCSAEIDRVIYREFLEAKQ